MENASQQKPAPDAGQMMNKLCDFICRYLVCTDEQAIILSIWILHAWVYRSFSVTPYLSIESPASQSGKTVCLKLLHLLSPPGSWFTTAPEPRLFMRRLLALKPAEKPDQERVQDLPSAVFLDEREFTIGDSNSQPILPFLIRGIRAADRYLYQPERSALREFSVFCAKVFAGTRPLPLALAQRCLHIRLQRKKPSDKVEPLRLDSVGVMDSRPLIEWMKQWAHQNAERVAANDKRLDMSLSTSFTPAEREIARPLAILANCIDESWFNKVCRSLPRISIAGEPESLTDGLQLLRDLRRLFEVRQNPAWLATADLLHYLQNLDHRPWSTWGRAPAREMSQLLRPFGINSSPQRISPQSVIKGYRSEDFEDAWGRYLG